VSTKENTMNLSYHLCVVSRIFSGVSTKENTENNRNEMKVNHYFPKSTKENTIIKIDLINSKNI